VSFSWFAERSARDRAWLASISAAVTQNLGFSIANVRCHSKERPTPNESTSPTPSSTGSNVPMTGNATDKTRSQPSIWARTNPARRLFLVSRPTQSGLLCPEGAPRPPIGELISTRRASKQTLLPRKPKNPVQYWAEQPVFPQPQAHSSTLGWFLWYL
jgi:hypothetical protein